MAHFLREGTCNCLLCAQQVIRYCARSFIGMKLDSHQQPICRLGVVKLH